MWSYADVWTEFQTEVGSGLAALASNALAVSWFNQGQSRLGPHWRLRTSDLTWLAADRSVALPTDFVSIQKLTYNVGVTLEPWRVFGQTLVIDHASGAVGAGGGRLYYNAEWPKVDDSPAQASLLPAALDYACLYYALHRFYKLLGSNRAYYKRYATMVGQNAVTMSDLQQESERYLQDFRDALADHRPPPPAYSFDA